MEVKLKDLGGVVLNLDNYKEDDFILVMVSPGKDKYFPSQEEMQEVHDDIIKAHPSGSVMVMVDIGDHKKLDLFEAESTLKRTKETVDLLEASVKHLDGRVDAVKQFNKHDVIKTDDKYYQALCVDESVAVFGEIKDYVESGGNGFEVSNQKVFIVAQDGKDFVFETIKRG